MFILYNADADGNRLDTDVTLHRDGRRVTGARGRSLRPDARRKPDAGAPVLSRVLRLRGGGSVLVGEVSSCNDDVADNRFFRAHRPVPCRRGGRTALPAFVHRIPARALTHKEAS